MGTNDLVKREVGRLELEMGEDEFFLRDEIGETEGTLKK